MNNRIMSAVATTRRIVPGYLEKSLAQRAGLSSNAAGSVYEGVDALQLERMLLASEWEPYSHPAIMPGCSAFKASIAGRLGVASLESLSPDAIVTLDDRKSTGQVSAVASGVRGEVSPFTVLILGPEVVDGETHEIVFTFHPGDPVRPSQVPAQGMHGRTVTVKEAIQMGLEIVKIVS